MKFRFAALFLALVLVSGCTKMKPSDFSETEPHLSLEKYFLGTTRAWGIFEDRFGTLRRQFTVDIEGSLDGEVLVLDERFVYADGETDRRIWRIVRTGEHDYQGRADDIVGVAEGQSYGNALNWRYDMDLKVGGTTLRVHFDDWMFLQPNDVLINRAQVTKFGIELGEVTLVFMKVDDMAEQADTQLRTGLPAFESVPAVAE